VRTVVFDLDGTLADTSGDLIAAANACFREMGRGDVLSPESDAPTALRGGKAMLRLGLERIAHPKLAEEVERWYPFLLKAYGEDICTHTVFYPGALESVEALRGAGYAVAICTNKPEGLAEALMARMGAREMFHALVGADTLPVRKPDPRPYFEAVRRAGGDLSRSLLVGDTATDRNTARAAEVPCVLVTFGPGDDDVRALEPEGLIGHYGELAGEVARLIG
jgi:phosphoglycolate phosphatase